MGAVALAGPRLAALGLQAGESWQESLRPGLVCAGWAGHRVRPLQPGRRWCPRFAQVSLLRTQS